MLERKLKVFLANKREKLHGQIGSHVRDELYWRATLRWPIPRDERHIGNADEAGGEAHHAIGSREETELTPSDKAASELDERGREDRFAKSYGLLR